MTHNVFLPTVQISQMLMLYYKMLDDKNDFQYENSINNKRKVIAFIKEWCEVAKDAFYEDQVIKNFFQVIFSFVTLRFIFDYILNITSEIVQVYLKSRD